MKTPLTITLYLLFFSVTSLAQPGDQEKDLAEAIEVSAGGTFGKPKILPKADKLAIVQVSVDFKQMTTKSVQKTEKKQGLIGKTPGKSATASVTAYLETADGELSASDYQEITHYFYYYLQKKLKESGIDTVAWSAVSNTEFFKDNEKEKPETNEEEKSKGNSWVTYNAFNGGTMYNGQGGFAFTKLKKTSKMCDDLGAPVLFVHTTVDFADLDVAVDVKTSGYQSTWTPSSSQTTTMKSETKVKAFMKIPAFTERTEYSYVVNDKNAAENVNVKTELPAEMNYATELTEDPSRAEKRSKVFSVSLSKKMESDPVVISTTKENYKAAAKKALEKYADAFVAKLKQMKKD
jgi:hypothetical protein